MSPLFRNRMLFLTVSISFLAQLGLIYVPLLQHVFQTEALGMRDLMTLLGLAATSMGAHEGRRWYERKLVQEDLMQRLSGGGLVGSRTAACCSDSSLARSTTGGRQWEGGASLGSQDRRCERCEQELSRDVPGPQTGSI